MATQNEWLTYGDRKQYLGYMAKPAKASGTLPAVIVLQEIWGVDGHIRDVTRRFADAGYLAFAPDLLAVDGRRPEALSDERINAYKTFMESLPPSAWHDQNARKEALDKLPEAERTTITETYQSIFGYSERMPAYVDQVVATAKFLRDECEASKGRKVGSVGFCLGGALSAQLACRDKDLSGAVIFYGTPPQKEQLANIACPVLGFYGSLDARITGQVPAFADAMEAGGKRFVPRIYEGAQHAFFNDTRGAYSVEAARDAFARTLDFFNEQLT